MVPWIAQMVLYSVKRFFDLVLGSNELHVTELRNLITN